MKIEKSKITSSKILTSFLSGLMKFVEKKPILSAIAETFRSLGEYEMDQIDDALLNATREDMKDVLNSTDVDTRILLVIKEKLDAQRENLQVGLNEQEKRIAERFSDLMKNLRDAVNDIATIKDAVLGRFVTLQQQEEFFWHNVINEKAIPALMERIGEEGKKYLRETFIGREKDLEDFRLFLQGGGHGAFCLEGDP